MNWLSYLPFIQPTEKESKENITTGNERFAQVSIHGVDVKKVSVKKVSDLFNHLVGQM